MSKTCTKCGETKPLDGFHRDSSRKDGRDNRCRPCKSLIAKEYRGRKGKRVRQVDRLYKKRNREKILADQRRYYEENRDILKSLNRENQRTNNAASTLLATRQGESYAPDEDVFLMADNGMTVYQKAITLGRTYRSCGKRLERLRARANH